MAASQLNGDEQPTPSADGAAVQVYVFRRGGGAVCAAATGDMVLLAFGSLSGFIACFGGYMTFGRVFSSNEYLGVWGHRNANRFRRILRERSGRIETVHAPPPARMSGRSVSGPRMTAQERRAFEQTLGEGR
jgi:hypothetical protein